MSISHYFYAALLLASLLLTPASAGAASFTVDAPPQAVTPVQGRDLPESAEKIIGPSTQLLLVRNTNPADVEVRVMALERRDGRWQMPFAPLEGVIGRKGFAPPGEKREGDGRTPSGIYPLGMVFGYAASFSTRMPYRQATPDDLWVDDVEAPDYNQWVKRGETKASSFERMRRDDDAYKYGIVVEYNTQPILKGQGSAIFLHLWRGRGMPTAGCIALAERDLLRILGWLDPAANPLIIMGTKVTIAGY